MRSEHIDTEVDALRCSEKTKGRGDEHRTDETQAAAATLIQTSLQYRMISAGLAFLTWGGWAYFVNQRSAGVNDAPPGLSALCHGSASCLITLFMLGAVRRLFHRFREHRYCLILPAAITTLLTSTVVTIGHVLVGTADVPMTVLPGVVVAFCFNLLTATKLRAQAAA